MPSPNPYRPASGAVLTINGGIWSATGRPTVTVSVTFDARLLVQAVADAARRSPQQVIYGLGVPRLTITLT